MADSNSTRRNHRFVDLTGKRFGKWTVISEATDHPSRSHVYWNCRCECGTETPVKGSELTASRSQGCKPCNKQHGMRGTPEYVSWQHMKDRCNNPNSQDFHRYGYRGITVSDEWNSFEVFYSDMGPRPSVEHSIERRDNDGNYEKSNCYWATRDEQSRNRRSNVMLTFQGETMCMKDLAAKFGIGASCFRKRLLKGWSIERALTEPAKTLNKAKS